MAFSSTQRQGNDYMDTKGNFVGFSLILKEQSGKIKILGVLTWPIAKMICTSSRVNYADIRILNLAIG